VCLFFVVCVYVCVEVYVGELSDDDVVDGVIMLAVMSNVEVVIGEVVLFDVWVVFFVLCAILGAIDLVVVGVVGWVVVWLSLCVVWLLVLVLLIVGLAVIVVFVLVVMRGFVLFLVGWLVE